MVKKISLKKVILFSVTLLAVKLLALYLTFSSSANWVKVLPVLVFVFTFAASVGSTTTVYVIQAFTSSNCEFQFRTVSCYTCLEFIGGSLYGSITCFYNKMVENNKKYLAVQAIAAMKSSVSRSTCQWISEGHFPNHI